MPSISRYERSRSCGDSRCLCTTHDATRAPRAAVGASFCSAKAVGRGLERGLGRRLLRDIQKGVVAGRFSAQDPLMSFLAVGGTVLAAIARRPAVMSAAGSEEAALRVLALDQRTLARAHGALLLRTTRPPPRQHNALAAWHCPASRTR